MSYEIVLKNFETVVCSHSFHDLKRRARLREIGTWWARKIIQPYSRSETLEAITVVFFYFFVGGVVFFFYDLRSVVIGNRVKASNVKTINAVHAPAIKSHGECPQQRVRGKTSVGPSGRQHHRRVLRLWGGGGEEEGNIAATRINPPSIGLSALTVQ